jgi:hypothetical protein
MVTQRRISAELRAMVVSRGCLCAADATALFAAVHSKRGGFAGDLFSTATFNPNVSSKSTLLVGLDRARP